MSNDCFLIYYWTDTQTAILIRYACVYFGSDALAFCLLYSQFGFDDKIMQNSAINADAVIKILR